MGKVYKVLGQLVPAVNNDEILYTVPALTNSVLSSISISNLEDSLTVSYRIAVVPSGQTLSPKHHLRYDKLLEARDDTTLSLGVTITAGDKVYVQASSSNVAFSCFGVEIT